MGKTTEGGVTTDRIQDRLRYGATCPVSSPGGELADDMLEASEVITDLLAACKWLVEYHEGNGGIVTLDEYLSRAKAAIAKAERI